MTIQLKDREKTIVLVDALRAISMTHGNEAVFSKVKIRLDTGDDMYLEYLRYEDAESDVQALQNGMNTVNLYKGIPSFPAYPTWPTPNDGTGIPLPLNPGIGDFPTMPIIYINESEKDSIPLGWNMNCFQFLLK